MQLYLFRGVIQSNHPIWNNTSEFRWDRHEDIESCEGGMESCPSYDMLDCPKSGRLDINIIPTLQHEFNFTSAAGYPQYTNYTMSFKDVLDYIYIDNDVLETVSIAPLPSENELSQYGAIPSKVFPSDHLLLGVDIRWKNPPAQTV